MLNQFYNKIKIVCCLIYDLYMKKSIDYTSLYHIHTNWDIIL